MEKDYKLSENIELRIVDIGASGGKNIRWKNLQLRHKAILFEPDPRSFDLIKNNKNDLIINTALSSEKKERVFYLCNKNELSSFYAPNKEFISYFADFERFNIVKTLKLKTDTLDNQLKNNSIDQIDFIKLDAQGYELEILKGSLHSLKFVTGIEIEVSFAEIYMNQPHFIEIDKFLRNYGFEMYDLKRYFWKRLDKNLLNNSNKGQLVFGDALYFRPPEKIVKLDKLSKLQILKTLEIYLAYGYCDLSLSLMKFPDVIKLFEINEIERIKERISSYDIALLKTNNFKGNLRYRKILQKILNKILPRNYFLKLDLWIKGTGIGSDENLGN